MILGWLGIVIFIIIGVTFRKLILKNEFALLHLLMALMYGMWLPLPIALDELLDTQLLQNGMIFGFVYLLMIVMTMALQTGHIAYVVKQNNDEAVSDQHANNIMATLSFPFEGIANVFKSLWALCLSITFWVSGENGMGIIMSAYSLLTFYYLINVLNACLVKEIKLFSNIKPNPIVTNIETFLFFLVLMIYISFNQ
jgi:hypothetical protein